MLALGTAAQATGTVYLYGLAFLVPAFRREYPGLTLAEAGLIVAAPGIGMVLGVLAWGAVADRRGERFVVTAGLGTAAAALGAAAVTGGAALEGLLVLAGIGGSAVYAASGRVVTGWFAPGERGLAMGIRQASQPAGVAIAGAALPALAGWGGTSAALLTAAAACLAAAVVCGCFLTDAAVPVTPATDGTGSPYRRPRLWRIHGGSALFVLAQAAIGAFALDYLVTQRGWAPAAAGPLLAAAQLCGGAARIAGGRWSDRVGDRIRPLRAMALAAAAATGLLAAASASGLAATVPVLLVAMVLTVGWHGIGYAAVAEAAPANWSGRALGAQTTIQNVAGAIAPPAFGALAGWAGYPIAYAALSVTPLAAALAFPRTRTGKATPTTNPRVATANTSRG
ncbi:MAG: hypothetical protein QOI35_421 [Cryptosporangiaceae bacterium]|nr:hypothetical protein [Cryptosporangiaceae bacterium]